MRSKLFLNIFYNIVIFVCAAGAYTSLQNSRWIWLTSFLMLGALFIIAKIKLIKEVRALQNNQKK
ncbi:hypothetical protein FPZ42_16550 [Mucilaginibacter achroorhodeus]|uniref:Uncharacterized protein n=1 Tax=Mucilaginibacter achroorhodeus TaxID=2599294 RepID=A0A563TXK5_9SPHI|nr:MULTISPECIES: DUF6358 family protein [Mucilaginibacter]QXV65886.1 hypothetical protein INP83_01975 [Mucilaginibacter sp. 21P]TWR24097.1 hypothetical protein FPZ42_16550 [Mucilaginibacter achroorhodeus]